MRSINHAHRTAAVLAVVVALSAGVAGTAQAAKGGKGKPGSGSTTTSTSSSTIANAHGYTCPKVMEYTSCGSMSVTVSDFGNVGWAGSANPSTNSVRYNSYYSGASQADWNNVVAHEVGGHVDAWNELVAKVGVDKAWTDYYDLDYFGAQWATARWSAVKGTSRTFSTGEGKEAYLDCAGPVAHGYQGNYLYSWGMTTASSQQSFCQGSAGVMTDALTKSRP